MATSSIETRLREAQASLTQTIMQITTSLQSSDWKGLQEKFQTLATGRSESSALLLLLDYLATRKRKVDSVFGKLLIGLSGYNLLAFALQGKPVDVWNKAIGLKLQGPDAEALGTFASGTLGATGALSLITAWTGPSNHRLSVLGTGLIKLMFGFVLINKATSGADGKAEAANQILSLGRYHARTGALLLAYFVMLVWRARSRLNAPKYIADLEKRMTEKLDQLVTVVKDQKTRLDAIAPTPATPKKY